MKSVALHNLGCKVNSYELDVMQQMLQEKGYQIVPFDQIADIYIINTCTVTNIADRKSRQMLHRAKQKNPNAVVVAVGCYVQTGEKAIAMDDSIDLAIGNNRKRDLARILEAYLEGQKLSEEGVRVSENAMDTKTLNHTTVIDINHTDEYEEMQLTGTAEHTRAYIKIQDGCNQFCSYCVIPFARGRVRSRREEDILTEIQGLSDRGYKEVVLTGIHISSYGVDFDEKGIYTGESRLIDLIERIHQEVKGLERIRLGSLEPRVITESVAARLAALPKLCPHFHLSLQSGSDSVLKRMNRRYTTGEYLQGVTFLRQAFAHPAITTDVIVGFPGETEEEFLETKAFVEQVGFFEMHIFKYSRRAGTRADQMPGQLSDKVKAARSDVLFHIEQAQSYRFRSDYIGKDVEILWEDKRMIEGREYWVGHTGDYIKVAVPAGEKELSNTLSVVCPTSFLTEEILVAE